MASDPSRQTTVRLPIDAMTKAACRALPSAHAGDVDSAVRAALVAARQQGWNLQKGKVGAWPCPCGRDTPHYHERDGATIYGRWPWQGETADV